MHVLLLREEEAEDAYLALLRSSHVSCACVRVLTEQVFGVDALGSVLRSLSPPLPSCIALTSRRAAAALASALDGLLSSGHAALHAHLRALPTLSVGARTAGGLQGEGSPAGGSGGSSSSSSGGAGAAAYAGSATALLPMVIDAVRCAAAPPGPVLFVCGERRLDALPAGLQAARIAVLEVPVYRMQALAPAQLQAEWAAGAAAGGLQAPAQPLVAVLFSPSGVEAAAAAGLLQGPTLLVAIGPTTAQALALAGLQCAAVATEPTPRGVLQAICSL